MDQAAAEWRYDELHKEMPFHDGTRKSWSVERTRSHPYHYRDGASIWVASVDLNPDDDFLSRGSIADQSPDDDAQSAECDVDPEASD
jgi:hypothetical protein